MRITKRLIENSAACALLLVTVVTLLFSVTNTLSVWNGWFKDNEISFILIVLSLLGLTSTLPQVLDILTSHDNFIVYDEQERANAFIESYIKGKGVHKAVLIQHSCRSADKLLHALLREGAQVVLYMQDEATAKSLKMYEQEDRIKGMCRDFEGEINKKMLQELTVYKYSAPSSISGVWIEMKRGMSTRATRRINEEILMMGWYTYEYMDPTNTHADYEKDKYQLSGHDVPTTIAWQGTSQFDALIKTFRTIAKNYEINAKLYRKQGKLAEVKPALP